MREVASFSGGPDFQLLFQSAPGLYLVLTPDLKIVAVSDAYLHATLTSRSEILGRGIFDVFPDNPKDPAATGVSKLRASLERVLRWKTADTMAIQKYDIRKPDDEGGEFEERYWSPVNTPVCGADKNVAYIIHRVEDVTENVRLRQRGIEQQGLMAELKAEERFRKAFNVNPEPIAITTVVEGRYIDVNEKFCQVTGYRREELIGRTSLEIGFWEKPEDRAMLIETLRTSGSVRDMEIGFRTKNGEHHTGLDSAELIEVAAQECIIAIFKDVTERKTLEKQLLQAQKMEAIGQLSAGIAHDFNNLLSVIIGYSEALEEKLSRDEELRGKCKEIRKAGNRGASLVRQLLAFSRQQILEPKVLDLNTVLLDSEKMLRVLLGDHIEFSFMPGTSLGNIKADHGQIVQVIMNLVVNARDAMPEGGRLAIETANVELDEEDARGHYPQQAGRYVVLSVSDTGMGMDAETQARIFDPFFTTKEIGKGTGLGLSTVYGVVKQSGGHIWVYSELGHGTTFKIYLPEVNETPAAERPVSAPTSFRGSETILLVDDEPALRELTRSILEDAGYTVIDAKSPHQAIEFAERYAEPIHLLLTDVVMPGMSGYVLAAKLAETIPGMKALYMSGYTGFTHRELLNPENVLVPKPITRDALLRKVRDVLSLSKVVQ